ncbi:hypothetical protein CBS9595_001691 [Malassezia furfur]|nr:hypothetical protein CBS9595_001691 [Malassezia furfur]
MLRWLGCVWWLVLVGVCAVHAHRQETQGRASPVTAATPGVKAPATPTPSWLAYHRAAPTLVPRQNAGTTSTTSGSSSGSSSSSDDDDRLPAGGLTVTQPAQTADESYYKIAPHETVTFGWSFTSLKTQPDRLFVVASCSQNGYTYPIAPSPQGIPGDATSVTWYPYGYRLSAQANGQPDLAAAKYRLVIYDEEGPSAAARGGRFSPNNAVEFAMYFPQAYTPLAEWNCPSCNGASTLSLRSPLVVGIGSTLLVGALSTLWLLP